MREHKCKDVVVMCGAGLSTAAGTELPKAQGITRPAGLMSSGFGEQTARCPLHCMALDVHTWMYTL